MKKVVWKYSLDKIEQDLEMPIGAKVLTAQNQDNHPMLWALVDPKQDEKESRHFKVFMTGEDLTGDNLVYVATIQINSIVGHVFEKV